MRALLPPGPGITNVRGRWVDLTMPGLDEPVPTLPIYHPSFLLRAPERCVETRADMMALYIRLQHELSAPSKAPPTNNKHEIGTFAHMEESARLLPTWFVPRMMDDVWSFGLLTNAGIILAVACIQDVRQAADGQIWLDAQLDSSSDTDALAKDGFKVLTAPTSRTSVSINAAHILAAFEIAQTPPSPSSINLAPRSSRQRSCS